MEHAMKSSAMYVCDRLRCLSLQLSIGMPQYSVGCSPSMSCITPYTYGIQVHIGGDVLTLEQLWHVSLNGLRKAVCVVVQYRLQRC